MSQERVRRASTLPAYTTPSVPPAPPLPPQPPKYSQQARNALNRVFGFGVRAEHDPYDSSRNFDRLPSLSALNAGATHRTGLDISSLSINEQGTHALLAGREIFKTVLVGQGTCAEEVNIRSAIRTYDSSMVDNASSRTRSKDTVEIHDVAWAKGTSGQFIAAATYNGPIILFDLERPGIEVARLFAHRRQVHRVTFNPHAGHQLLSASQDGTVRFWDIRDCQRNVSTFPSKWSTHPQHDGIRDVKWSPTNGTELALGTDGGWIQKWDTRMLRGAKMRIAAHSSMCSTIDWHPDGRHLLSASADKTLKIWNLAVEGRRKKPAYEITTPYPLRNARWRPSCPSSMPGQEGARQCTQIATSYERDYPIIHIWDLRRPLLPFREVECFATAPTDLLWHSQDLLWTVGREGTFMQTDMKFSRKVLDKRNMQAAAVSPFGEIMHFTQRTANRYRPEFDAVSREQLLQRELSPHRRSEPGILERMGRGSHDDSIDETFLRAARRRSSKRRPNDRKDSRTGLGNVVSADQMSTRTVRLDQILDRQRFCRPTQSAARGQLPGASDTMIVAYLAQKYKHRPFPQPPSVDDLLDIRGAFDQNAQHAQLASHWRLAQSWRIVGQVVSRELRQRAASRKKKRLSGLVKSRQGGIVETSALVDRAKDLYQARGQRSKPNTPAVRPQRIKDALQPGQTAITSDAVTPLARPVISTHDQSGHTIPTWTDGVDDVDLILPPAVLSPTAYRLSGALKAEVDHNDSPSGTVSVDKGADREHNGEGRAVPSHWRAPVKKPLTLEPVYHEGLEIPPKLSKHNSDESFVMFSSLSSSRKASLPDSFTNSRSHLMDIVHENLMGSSSEETPDLSLGRSVGLQRAHDRLVQMEADSSLSSDVSTNSPQSPEKTEGQGQDTEAVSNGQDVPRRNVDHEMATLALNNQESFVSQSETQASDRDNDDAATTIDEMHASGTIVPESKARNSREIYAHRPDGHTESAPAILDARATADAIDANLIVADFLETRAVPESSLISPFSMTAMLRELIRYHTTVLSDAQTSTHLLLLLIPLLPETHPLPPAETDATLAHYSDHLSTLGHSDEAIFAILQSSFEHLITAGVQPLQVESIMSTYHDQLLSLGLSDDAAYIRRLAYPTFPAVYEQGLRDNVVDLRCGGCKKPINAGRQLLRCESCGKRQATCPICWCKESAFEGAGNKHRRKRKHVVSQPDNTAMPSLSVVIDGGGSGEAEGQRSAPDGSDAATKKISRPPVLYSTCLTCNHSAHAACLSAWHGSGTSSNPCPTPGCLCLCVSPKSNDGVNIGSFGSGSNSSGGGGSGNNRNGKTKGGGTSEVVNSVRRSFGELALRASA